MSMRSEEQSPLDFDHRYKVYKRIIKLYNIQDDRWYEAINSRYKEELVYMCAQQKNVHGKILRKVLVSNVKVKKTKASVARWMNMGKSGKRDCRTCWGGARPLCYCWNTKSQGLPLAPNSSYCKRVPWIETDPFLSAFLEFWPQFVWITLEYKSCYPCSENCSYTHTRQTHTPWPPELCFFSMVFSVPVLLNILWMDTTQVNATMISFLYKVEMVSRNSFFFMDAP